MKEQTAFAQIEEESHEKADIYMNLLTKGKAGRLSGPSTGGACGPARRMGGGQYTRLFYRGRFSLWGTFCPPRAVIIEYPHFVEKP